MRSFVNLIIMWVVNIVDCFVGDVGVEVMSQEIIELSMLLFSYVIIFLATFIYIIMIRFIVSKVLMIIQ